MANGGATARPKVALITGITGQDGSYLAELLISKGYEVHGIIRRSSSFNTGRIAHLYDDPNSHSEGRMHLHYGDLIDGTNLVKIINEHRPSEIYNLAAQSHVKVSFDVAEYTAEVDGVGTLRLLDAIKTCGLEKSVKFYQVYKTTLISRVFSTMNQTGFHVRAVRKSSRSAPDRKDPLLPPIPIRSGKALRVLERGQLQGGLQHVRRQRYPVQPRESQARRNLCDAQDHAVGCQDLSRHHRVLRAGQPGRPQVHAIYRPRFGYSLTMDF